MELMNVNEKIKLILNPITNVPFTTISCFVAIGMKDDINYASGTAHLSEHLLINKLMFDSNPYIYTNAYVDKEYTCFYGQVVNSFYKDYMSAFTKLYVDFSIDTSDMEKEKNIIAYNEDKKTLSNHRLLDLERLEYKIHNDGVKELTIVDDENLFRIDEDLLKKFISHEHLKSNAIFVISGIDLDKQFLYENVIDFFNAIIPYNSNVNCKIYDNTHNKLWIQNYKPKHYMAALRLDKVTSVKEFFALNMLCTIYKTFINNLLSSRKNHVIDISLKLYSKMDIMFFYYHSEFNDTLASLKKLSKIFFESLIDSVKKNFIFSLTEKLYNPLEYNKFIFKSLYFINEFFDPYADLEKNIDLITPEYLFETHNKCLNGLYIS